MARQGLAGHGSAWRGMAWHGAARRGAVWPTEFGGEAMQSRIIIDWATREVRFACAAPEAGHWRWTVQAGRSIPITVTGEIEVITISVDEPIKVGVKPLDSHGNPTGLDGVPAWSVSDEAILSFEVADEAGLTAIVTPAGLLGVAQIVCRGDAARGEDVREIVGTLDIEVIAGEAATLTIERLPDAA